MRVSETKSNFVYVIEKGKEMKFCNLECDFKDCIIRFFFTRSTIICMLKCTSIYFVTKINPRNGIFTLLFPYKRIK